MYLQEQGQGGAGALDHTIQSHSLYESPAFHVSRQGLDELLTEVKRVDALITNKPPGHPVSITIHSLHTNSVLLMPTQCSKMLCAWGHRDVTAVLGRLQS